MRGLPVQSTIEPVHHECKKKITNREIEGFLNARIYYNEATQANDSHFATFVQVRVWVNPKSMDLLPMDRQSYDTQEQTDGRTYRPMDGQTKISID